MQIVLLQMLGLLITSGLGSALGIASLGWFEPFSNLAKAVVGSLFDIAPLLAYLSLVVPDRIAEVFD